MTLSEKEEKILKSIIVASENDPNRPEFPPDNPKFPATPTYKIEVPGFSNVWLKDESINPTGTHKDRMAWEMVVTYRNILLAKKRGQTDEPLLHMSIISSGAAAIAIQTQFNRYKLPRLKVLLDSSLVDPVVIRAMEKLGCEVHDTDLSKKPLTWEKILVLTYNHNGFDITSNEALDQSTRYYDWMSYEILNTSPAYCFIPFGSGSLYENILNTNKREVSTKNHDPRFKGDLSALQRCGFMGATTNSPGTKADKLYSPHLPFLHVNEQWIKLFRSCGFCSPVSDVYLIRENYLDKAMDIAESQGITCEYSGIAGLALMLQMKNQLPTNKKMLIINTGKTKY
ncbi:MAG: pyridoxal-phosphate dependent enzyme [Candidatus Micrarchaeota archaeon]|nr:pyridoxal-phosphate dependent enzyme [Candidatus Micrarchaeota archaeon]